MVRVPPADILSFFWGHFRLTHRAVALLLFSTLTLRAQTFVNGQAARAVIGQSTFTAGNPNPNQQTVGGVSGLAYANNMLFVADSNIAGATPLNNRVLRFNTAQIPAPNADLTSNFTPPDSQCYLCGYSAANVLGQSNYTNHASGVTNQAMNAPTGVATDGQTLVVADTNNNRVLIWRSIPASVNQPADVVIGQTNFTAGTGSTTQSTLLGPQGVWIQGGKLFVADSANNRVLIWNTIPTANGQPADVVLGQSNFTSGGTPSGCQATNLTLSATAAQLCNPVSVTSDGVHLFVADLGFNRVLIWNHIPTANGQPADVAVGQPNLTGATSNSGAACGSLAPAYPNGPCVGNLSLPRYALSDGTRLFIADGGNDRVLIYNSIPTTSGAFADVVLGQPDFRKDIVTSITSTIASTAIDNTGSVDTIPSPQSLAYDGVNLYVSDPYNRRVLVFTPGNTTLNAGTNPVVNWASEEVRQEGVVQFQLVGTITAKDTATITIQGTAYTYTVQSSDTLDSIAQGLVSAINANAGDPNVTAIFAGVNTGAVYLSSKKTNLPFDSITLAASTSNSSNVTAVASGGYLSAGTAATGSPGMLVEINGSNLSNYTSATAPDSGTSPLPTTLFGTQVYMDGIPSPVLKVSPSQVVSQIPYEFTNRNSTSVYVRTVHNDGSVTITNAVPVYIAPADPGLFNAPAFNNQVRPWPATRAYHQPGNPTAVVSVDGSANAGDISTISVNGRSYSYTEKSGDTLGSIVNGLVSAINSAPDPQVTAAPGAAFDRVVITARQGGTAGTGIPISASASSSAKVTLTAYTSKTCCAVQPGSLITPTNPAGPGELITMSGSGLGILDGIPAQTAQITGLPYNGPVPNNASNSVSATMGGTTAQVVAAGLPTGSYGIYQIQMIVPSDAPTNNTTQVYIAQNAFVSNIATIAVGPTVLVPPPPPPATPVGAIRVNIDRPNNQSSAFSGTAAFGGWAYSNALVTGVQVSVDGIANGTASYGGNRQDVCTALGTKPGCPNLGWDYVLDTTQFADGTHTLGVTVTDASGAKFTTTQSFTTSNYGGNLPTHITIDNPAPQGGTLVGWVSVSGWALNDNAVINAVTVSIDGQPAQSATYGAGRPDVAAAFPGRPGSPNFGWSYFLDTTTLANGRHTLVVSATAADGEHALASRTFAVANWTTSNNPFHISVDIPGSQSGPFSGIAAFGGWAVNDTLNISSIGVKIDGQDYGNAGYGANRSDVCNILTNRPGCPNVGWNFLIDTTTIGDGTHTLAITASTVVGPSYTTTVPFKVANQGTSGNATRVNIDRPSNSDYVFSGVTAVGGWALNGSDPIATVQLFVDGIAKGNATYGGDRADVCAKYTGPGCPNVGWNAFLDTNSLANGTHTLEATATSIAGQRATASAAFSVANGPSSGPTSIYLLQPNGSSSPFQGLAPLSGTAYNSGGSAVTVSISIDGTPYGSAMPCTPGFSVSCQSGAWVYLLDTTQLTDGAHTLAATATAADGTFAITSTTFQVANWSVSVGNPMHISIDTPASLSGAFSGIAHFGGWALDNNSAISGVQLAVDGVSFGPAIYGGTRSDVCALRANSNAPGCPNVGWNAFVDTGTLSNGMHTLAITGTAANGQSSTVTQLFSVAN